MLCGVLKKLHNYTAMLYNILTKNDGKEDFK